MNKIVLTGGGTAGHVSPNLALLPSLQKSVWEVEYIGSYDGIERQLVNDIGITYHGIASGKLRRYIDFQNFTDPLNVIKGIWEAFWLLRKIKPAVVFSKGGFVTVPVIVASWLNRIPVIIHESDLTPGLANKISMPFATKICVTFPESLAYVPKAICTGLPIRQEILAGDAIAGMKLCSFDRSLPILLVIGGSTGAQRINQVVRACLDRLTPKFQIVHACGKGQSDRQLENHQNYQQFEYLGTELADILAMTDVVISRAGANAIFEFLALQKPNLLIPLSKAASRGDQILNARSFANMGYSAVLPEEDLTESSLVDAIDRLFNSRQDYIAKMRGGTHPAGNRTSEDSIAQIVQLIESITAIAKTAQKQRQA
jgi:UDP-N-acetylglucosamine--N-acetylmuramyl-(pentapeptide) pyrophosphoryl-undecaprenol N-acetylglucosamine transferase